MPRAWLVHGFNVHDNGAATVDRLRPYLEALGWAVCDVDYGWRGLIGVRLGNRETARELAERVDDGDVAIGHSNGGCICWMACQMMAALRRVVLVNPALDRDAVWPAHVHQVQVWHASSDVPTLWSEVLVAHPWGAMGRHGGAGEIYANHDEDAIASEQLGAPVELGHSGVFHEPWINTFGPLIAASAGAPRMAA